MKLANLYFQCIGIMLQAYFLLFMFYHLDFKDRGNQTFQKPSFVLLSINNNNKMVQVQYVIQYAHVPSCWVLPFSYVHYLMHFKFYSNPSCVIFHVILLAIQLTFHL